MAFSVLSPARFLVNFYWEASIHTNETKKSKQTFEVILLKLRMILAFNDWTSGSEGLAEIQLGLVKSMKNFHNNMKERSSPQTQHGIPFPSLSERKVVWFALDIAGCQYIA